VNNIKKNIAKNLKSLREERKITQIQLAEVLGVKHNTVSSWENGTNSIDISLVMQICKYLNVSLDDMFGRKSKDIPTLEMSEVEKKLIFSYRNLSRDNQLKVTGIIEFMFDEESAAKEEHEDKIKRMGK
jgi:transcriptional regulator with XRE-family HTH domain